MDKVTDCKVCLTLFWLGFFMNVKWLGGRITPLSKIFKKDATRLKFTPQLGNHRKFQKKLKKNFDPIFSMTSAILWQKMAQNNQIRVNFKIL